MVWLDLLDAGAKTISLFFSVALFGICCGHVPGLQKVLGGHRESFGREKNAERSFGLEVSHSKPPNFFRFSFARQRVTSQIT